jgi:hypothetical protein
MKNTKIEILKNKAKQELEEDEKYNNEISENIIEKYYRKIEYIIEEEIKNSIKENKEFCIVNLYYIDKYINAYKEDNKNNINLEKFDKLTVIFLVIEKVINKISKEYVVKRFFNGYQVAILINSSIFTNIKARISLLHLICSQKIYNPF